MHSAADAPTYHVAVRPESREPSLGKGCLCREASSLANQRCVTATVILWCEDRTLR
jgi:hypothetical protein